jgi:hypothetical protein
MKIIDLDDAVVAGDGDDSDYQTILFNRPPPFLICSLTLSFHYIITA